MGGIEALQKRRELGIKNKPSEFNLIKRSQKDPNSRAKAINAFCFNCMGGTINEMPESGWKKEIRFCTDENCPLYSFRPYQTGDDSDI